MANRRFTPEEVRKALINDPRDQHRRNAEHLRANVPKAKDKARKAGETAATLPVGSKERRLQEYWVSYYTARAEYYAEQAEREDQAAQR